MRTLRLISITSSVLLIALTGCRSKNVVGGPANGGPPGMMMMQPTVTCPGTTLTICDVQFAASPRHPAIDDPVDLTAVLVTTPTVTVSERNGVVTLAGFYVQDTAVRDALDGRYSGIQVVYAPGSLAGDGAPLAGEIVTITGTYDEFTRDGFPTLRQIRATRLTKSGQRGTITPIKVSKVSDIGRGGVDGPSYEGVLLRVEAVAVSTTDVKINGMDLFYAFEVESSLIVSGSWYTYRNPVPAEQFTSITGILRLGTAPFEGGQYLLSPRFEADVVPQTAAAVVRTMADVQDPTAPGRPLEGCENVSGQTDGKCAVAELEGMVVTAVDGYVSRNLRALWMQDPTDADGRYAGVKVVYNPNSIPYVPEVGHIIDVDGEIIEYRGGTQIQFPTIRRRGTDTASIAVTVVATAADVARKNPNSNAYEGVLIRIENVAVETFCLEDTSGRDHGNWTVTGDVMVGSSFMYGYNGDIRPSEIQCLDTNQEPTGLCGCMTPGGGTARPNDARTTGDQFRSITGIIDFSFGDYQLQVRGDFDLDKI